MLEAKKKFILTKRLLCRKKSRSGLLENCVRTEWAWTISIKSKQASGKTRHE
jgi:hypothetical protein